MFKRLPLVAVLLIGASLVFAALIAKELTTSSRPPMPRPPAAPVVAAPDAAAGRAAAAPPVADGYTTVASRNLFSPTRTEAPPLPKPVAAVPVNLPKPSLYGVVFHDGTPIAYLQDPVTKRIARYRIGDSVAGGTLDKINADNVVLSRPDGPVSVRLHDPTRPRPPAPTATPPTPGVEAPGVPTPSAPSIFAPQGAAPAPTPRRALPPGVLGRVPPQGN